MNEIGWSAWSPHDYLLMAGVPNTPKKPTYISSTATTITIQLYDSIYSDGAPILGYQVWRDLGDNLSELATKETNYDGKSLQYQLTGLTPGVTYKIASLAFNSEGSSPLSYYVSIAATSLPDAPAALFKDPLKSTNSSVHIYWDRVADKEMPTTGYILQAAILGSQNFETIYDGVDLP